MRGPRRDRSHYIRPVRARTVAAGLLESVRLSRHAGADRQTLATLRAPTLQHLPSVVTCHPCAESVLVATLPATRLKCAFHISCSLLRPCRIAPAAVASVYRSEHSKEPPRYGARGEDSRSGCGGGCNDRHTISGRSVGRSSSEKIFSTLRGVKHCDPPARFVDSRPILLPPTDRLRSPTPESP